MRVLDIVRRATHEVGTLRVILGHLESPSDSIDNQAGQILFGIKSRLLSEIEKLPEYEKEKQLATALPKSAKVLMKRAKKLKKGAIIAHWFTATSGSFQDLAKRLPLIRLHQELTELISGSQHCDVTLFPRIGTAIKRVEECYPRARPVSLEEFCVALNEHVINVNYWRRIEVRNNEVDLDEGPDWKWFREDSITLANWLRNLPEVLGDPELGVSCREIEKATRGDLLRIRDAIQKIEQRVSISMSCVMKPQRPFTEPSTEVQPLKECEWTATKVSEHYDVPRSTLQGWEKDISAGKDEDTGCVKIDEKKFKKRFEKYIKAKKEKK